MKLIKNKIHELEKCYAITTLTYNGTENILVAAEKINKCYMFDLDGNLKDTIWTEPGGTMSMLQVPNSNGQFLATHKFYSPNDSKEAKIVVVTPTQQGGWDIQTLIDLPHVHRFDIITRNGVFYLIACTLCSGRDFKDDWSYKGKVYACKLPKDLSIYNENNQLEMNVIKDNLLKNHGYFRGEELSYQYSVVGSEDGVYKIIPPKDENSKFEIISLLNTPVSDMTLLDLDNDGELELITFSPFHGANIDIYKYTNNQYHKVFHYDEPFEFSHALWSGIINGKKTVLLGNREGKRQLIGLTYKEQQYHVEIYDSNVGPANILAYQNGTKTFIVSANREINEIAFYEVREEL